MASEYDAASTGAGVDGTDASNDGESSEIAEALEDPEKRLHGELGKDNVSLGSFTAGDTAGG